MTLRKRLVLVISALMIVGLSVAALATHSLLSSFLQNRLDQQLMQIQAPSQNEGSDNEGPSGPGNDQLPSQIPRETYLAYFDTQGKLLNWFDDDGLPHKTKVPTFLKPDGQGYRTQDGHRILTSYNITEDKELVVVLARSLKETTQTLHRLLLIELLSGSIVLFSLVMLGSVLIKKELRPLEKIKLQSQKIARGDLSQRVEDTSPRDEVGQLSISLNSMLEQIERSFHIQKESEEKLRQFIADASHELKTPLTSLQGYAELYRYGALQDQSQIKDAMQRIEQEAARMAALVEDLLALARMDEDLEMEKNKVNLHDLVLAVADNYKVLYPNWPLTVDFEDDIILSADEVLLRRAVENLLTNAYRYAGETTAVEVKGHVADGHVLLEIQDHGIGIEKQHHKYIFERFMRVDDSRTRATGGSGLGLSIVRTIAHAHGGEISMHETKGGGATFIIKLPLDL